MIHQLILNSLLACQPKSDVKTPVIALPKPVTEIKEPVILAKKIDATSEFITIVTKRPKAKESKSDENFHANPVRLSNIPASRDSYTDENFCNQVCTSAFNFSSVETSGYAELGNLQNCKLELITDWEEQLKAFFLQSQPRKIDPVVGSVECNAELYYIMEGRAAMSLSHGSETKSDIGGYFARAAQEEMTAVFAFQEMLENLRTFGAPAQLLNNCERAICDEQRHTMMMSAFAKRHGCDSAVVKLPTQKSVSLFELAKHNAIAGCIEETWSAVTAQYRSEHTNRYSKLFAIIAKDETFHAQFSWDCHQWLMKQLSSEEQLEIQALMFQHLKQSPPSDVPNIDFGEMDPLTRKNVWAVFSSRLAKQVEKSVA